MSSKKKINIKKVIIVILVVIGALTVLDNTWRLGRELGKSITSTIKNHRWNMVVVQ